MNIFNLFNQNKQQNDKYWEFDKTVHYRPKLNIGDFFRLTGFDFGWFVLEPISNFINDSEGEITKGKSLMCTFIALEIAFLTLYVSI